MKFLPKHLPLYKNRKLAAEYESNLTYILKNTGNFAPFYQKLSKGNIINNFKALGIAATNLLNSDAIADQEKAKLNIFLADLFINNINNNEQLSRKAKEQLIYNLDFTASALCGIRNKYETEQDHDEKQKIKNIQGDISTLAQTKEIEINNLNYAHKIREQASRSYPIELIQIFLLFMLEADIGRKQTNKNNELTKLRTALTQLKLAFKLANLEKTAETRNQARDHDDRVGRGQSLVARAGI